MAKIIYESQIMELVDLLSKRHLVYVPAENNLSSFSGQFKFRAYQKGEKIILRYPFTVLPPTEFLLPPKETLFSFVFDRIIFPNPESQVIFGLSLEDLEGIHRLKEIFTSPPKDKNFSERIESSILVAVDRFSAPAGISYDIYLQEIEGGAFLALAGSKKGKKILEKSPFKEYEKSPPKVLPAKDIILNNPKLPMAIKKSRNHQIWDELSEICFGCGICSYVCPMCYCFDVSDEIGFSEGKGTRQRSWDSCMLKGFAETSAGNFRQELRDRIYHWYFHKFVQMPKEYGFSGCTNCNRCTLYCPAKISYKKTLRTILSDYEKKEIE